MIKYCQYGFKIASNSLYILVLISYNLTKTLDAIYFISINTMIMWLRVIFFIFYIFFQIIFSGVLFAQNSQKELTALSITTEVNIDGLMDEAVWGRADTATGFHQWQPYNDRPGTFPTYVYVLYDNEAIYIGAEMFDPYPDSILTQLGIRDAGNRINADHFWIDINPFNDGVNGFSFMVSASGVQTDINRSTSGGGGENGINWDAAWWSDVAIHDQGWSVEMKIPYSALRFPGVEKPVWGINFFREIKRYQETSTWTFIKRGVGSPLNYLGNLTGIRGIKPPLRLSFFPYLSTYLEKEVNQENRNTSFNGGMDLKWGINEAFTMDMTLVPDFGQVQSDEKVLNLSPFEVRYDERRQFFTEGMELFQRANLFYSRRIGSTPKRHNEVFEIMEDTEVLVENPLETRMINATKVSGRTFKGLGIGVLNAITLSSHAVCRDTTSDIRREILTQPLTNYNLLVLDHSLPNNSYIGLINTNVLMDQQYMANVTGTEFNFNDKTNRYGIRGEAALSQLYYDDQDNIFGYKYDIRAGKLGGKIQYSLSREEVSDQYDQNDLGYLRRNNEIENQASFEYNIFDPFGPFLDFSTGLSYEHNQLYNPRVFTGSRIDMDARSTFVNRYEMFMRLEYKPVGTKDYFEPRVEGRYYQIDPSYEFFGRLESDPRKKLAVGGDFRIEKFLGLFGQTRYGFEITPRLRLNDRFDISAGTEHFTRINDIGYVMDISEDSIFFGKRHSPTIVNTLESNYVFSRNISLSFNLRHYWARVDYDGEYYFLNQDGTLAAIEQDLGVADINYNAFTIDMIFKWNFAPASWITVMWKNIVDSEGSLLINNYFDNVDQLFRNNQMNSFSVKVLYFLDYQFLRNRLTHQ